MTTITEQSQLTKRQRAKFGPTHLDYSGTPAVITAEVRFDDDCGNGHNTFSITGDIYAGKPRTDRYYIAGGCCHEEIAKAFPQLAPLIKWHLCSTDGPMHYVSNTMYHAGDRDHNGHRAGEPSAWESAVQFGDFPILWRSNRHSAFMKWMETAEGSDFEVLAIAHENRSGDNYAFAPNYTLGGAPDKWHECPFDTEREALEFLEAMKRGYKVVKTPTAYSTGKVRDLDAARACAIWPDATDEELTAPDLKQKLEARLPGLLAEFRAAVESLGFTW